MARRAKSASAVAEPRTKATVRAQLDILQLAGTTAEIVNAWNLWRARPRPDAVEILIDSLVEFDHVINPQRLTFDQWRAGGSVDYRCSRVVGVAVCGLVEVYFEILERLGLTEIISGDSIIEGTLDANQLAEVEELLDSLSRLAEILRAAAVSDEFTPDETQAVESRGQLDPYTSLKKFSSDSLRGKEQQFLRLVIQAMIEEPSTGLKFASLSQIFDDPDFDSEEFAKNKIKVINQKLRRNHISYRLAQQSLAAILKEIPRKSQGLNLGSKKG